MNKAKVVSVVCSRGHIFLKSGEQPVCPVCWPGRYKKSKNAASKTKLPSKRR